VLALDLGGTQIRAAVVQPDGRVLGARRSRTPVESGGAAIVAACIAGLRAVMQDHLATADRTPFVGIGIAAPGPVDPHVGLIIDPPNLGRSFHDTPLAALVADALGLPTFLDRDTQVAALAEGRFGAAAGCPDYVYLTVSTGIGGAVVTGGRLLRGPGLVGRGHPLRTGRFHRSSLVRGSRRASTTPSQGGRVPGRRPGRREHNEAPAR
jgi:glucokinase